MDIANVIAANPALPMFFVSAVAGSSLVAWGIFKHLEDKKASEAKALADQLANLSDIWPKIDLVNKAAGDEPWAILAQPQRDECAAALSRLDRLARQYRNPKVWHLVLSGYQYDLLHHFLEHIRPLVLVLRHTDLSITGANRPYNGDRNACGKALYRALAMPLPTRSR